MAEVLLEAWECWDGSEGKHQFKKIEWTTTHDIHAQALEFAFEQLDPYDNDIKHYAKYMATQGYDYDTVYHDTLIECAHYNLWTELDI